MFKNIYSRNRFKKLYEAEKGDVATVGGNDSKVLKQAWDTSLLGSSINVVAGGAISIAKWRRKVWAIKNLNSKLNKELLKGLIFWANTNKFDLETGKSSAPDPQPEPQPDPQPDTPPDPDSGSTSLTVIPDEIVLSGIGDYVQLKVLDGNDNDVTSNCTYLSTNVDVITVTESSGLIKCVAETGSSEVKVRYNSSEGAAKVDVGVIL